MKDSKLGDPNRREFLSRAAIFGGLVATSGPLSLLSGCADVNPIEPLVRVGSPRSSHGGVHFLHDTFTGANNTEISTRTGETGATWTKHASYTSGEARIDANRCRGHSAPAAYYASGVPADANYYVETVCYVATTATTYAGPAVRMSTSADTMYYSYYDGSAWQIMKRVAGIVGAIGSGWAETLSANNSRTVRLEVSGTGATVTLNLYINGTLRDTASDNQSDRILAAGRAGFRIPIAGAAGTGMQLDSITGVGGGGGGITRAFNDFSSGNLGPDFDDAYLAGEVNQGVITDPTGSGRGNIWRIKYTNGTENLQSSDRAIRPLYYVTHQPSYGDTIWCSFDVYFPSASRTPFNAAYADDNRKILYYTGNLEYGQSVFTILHRKEASRELYMGYGSWMGHTVLTEEGDENTGIVIPDDTWVRLEMKQVNNSADQVRDGVIEIYKNGSVSPNYSKTTGLGWITEDYPGPGASAFKSLMIGTQTSTDHYPALPRYDEYRYFDNVYFGDTRR